MYSDSGHVTHLGILTNRSGWHVSHGQPQWPASLLKPPRDSTNIEFHGQHHCFWGQYSLLWSCRSGLSLVWLGVGRSGLLKTCEWDWDRDVRQEQEVGRALVWYKLCGRGLRVWYKLCGRGDVEWSPSMAGPRFRRDSWRFRCFGSWWLSFAGTLGSCLLGPSHETDLVMVWLDLRWRCQITS